MGLDQDGAGQAEQGGRVGEHPDDVGAAFDLLVHPLQRVSGPDLLPVRDRELGEGRQFGSASRSIASTVGNWWPSMWRSRPSCSARGRRATAIVAVLEKSTDKPVQFEVERNGTPMTLGVTPRATPARSAHDSRTRSKACGPYACAGVRLELRRNWDDTRQIGRTVRDLFTGETPVKQLMGPVAIAELSGSAASLGWLALLGLMASISLNLALLNLMPVPVLDGGQMTILMMEGLFRRDLSMKWKEGFAIAGALMIVTLMVTVLYNDIASA